MENEFISYEQALALKELGFDETTLGIYVDKELEIGGIWKDSVKSKVIQKAPLYQQVFRWFREKYKLFSEVNLTTKQENVESFEFFVLNVNEPLFESDDYTVYEEAELACLRKLIEIVNQNKDDE